MRISRNASAIGAYAGVRKATNQLYASMEKLSSGKRLNRPGDGPASFGMAEMLRFQIRVGREASRNIENARNLIGTADSWLQESHNIVHRMSELAVAATDSSKNRTDLEALEVEYQQLKEELQRIGREASYNGVQVAGRDQVLAYDADKETFCFSQLNGGESYQLDVKVLSGLESKNAQDFLFDPSKGFTLSGDGRHIFYVDSQDHLARYDIENGALTRDTADNGDKSLEVDEKGRLWYATETASGSGVYSLRLENTSSWQPDALAMPPTAITDMGSKAFSVFDDRIYYLDTSNNVVSRGVNNTADLRMEMLSSEHSFNVTQGEFALSKDGRFVADVSAPGTLRLTSLETGESSTFSVDSAIAIDQLQFSVDGNELGYIDTATGNVHRVGMAKGGFPSLTTDETVLANSGSTGYVGFSLGGSSHRSRFKVQVGSQSGQELFMVTGDVRLHTLGLSRTTLIGAGNAQKASKQLEAAVARIGVQRSILGAEESRLMSVYGAGKQYGDNLMMAESVMRDVDIAAESARMMDLQVRQQAATAILAQANQQSGTVLRLLQA